ADVRQALQVFASKKHLAASEVTAYNPAKDSDGTGARQIVDLLAEVFGARLDALKSAAASAEAPAPTAAPSAEAEQTPAASESAVAPGEAWSSEDIEIPIEPPEPAEPGPLAHERTESQLSRKLSAPQTTRAAAWHENNIVDMDGVLLDVRGSIHRTVLQTVKF